VVDDWGREITEVKGRIDALTGRVLKVERWVEYDSAEFHKKMEAFVNHYKGAEEARDKLAKERHTQNIERMAEIKQSNDRWNLILTIIGAVVGVCMLYLSVKSMTHADSDPSKLFHAEKPVPALSSNQDTGETREDYHPEASK